MISVVDFDTSPTGIVASGSSVGGITFTYDFGGVSLKISDVYDTTSPDNFLGTDDSDNLGRG